MNSIFESKKLVKKRKKAEGLPARYAKIILSRLKKKGLDFYSTQTVYNVATGRTENFEIELEIELLRRERLEARKRILELRFEIKELKEHITEKEKGKPT